MANSEQGNLAFDSERQYLGTVYAKALLGAGGSEQWEAILDELDSVVNDVLVKLPGLESTLASPRVPLDAKEKLIDKAFTGGSQTILNFMKVVCQHGRFDSIRVIFRTARTMVDEHLGQLEVTLITATESDDETQARIADRLSEKLGRRVRLHARVDASLLGGMVLKVGDTVYDGSLSNQLDRVRHAAMDRTMQQIREALDEFVVDA